MFTIQKISGNLLWANKKCWLIIFYHQDYNMILLNILRSLKCLIHFLPLYCFNNWKDNFYIWTTQQNSHNKVAILSCSSSMYLATYELFYRTFMIPRSNSILISTLFWRWYFWNIRSLCNKIMLILMDAHAMPQK